MLNRMLTADSGGYSGRRQSDRSTEGVPEVEEAGDLGAGYAAGGGEATGVSGRPLGDGPVIDTGNSPSEIPGDAAAAGDLGPGGTTTGAAGIGGTGSGDAQGTGLAADISTNRRISGV